MKADRRKQMKVLRDYHRAVVRRWRRRTRRDRIRHEGARAVLLALARPVLAVYYEFQRIREQTAICGVTVREHEGVSIPVQVWRQVKLAAVGPLPSGYFYQFLLYRPEIWSRRELYIHAHQMHVLLNHPPYSIPEDEVAITVDKVRFREHCRRHDLPTIPVLALVTKSDVSYIEWNNETRLPEKDLFSKPVDLGEGIGAGRWILQTDGRYRGEDDRLVDSEGLLGALLDQAAELGHDMILQKRFRNHRDLERITGSSLATVRAATGLRPGTDTDATFLTAVMKLSSEESPTSHTFISGNMTSGVNHDGSMRAARRQDPSKIMKDITHHPESGERIEGFVLPGWGEMVELCIRAHETLPGIPFIGWDVALTDDGPVLVEANIGFGAVSLQFPADEPLGETEFVEYYVGYVENTDWS